MIPKVKKNILNGASYMQKLVTSIRSIERFIPNPEYLVNNINTLLAVENFEKHSISKLEGIKSSNTICYTY